VKRAKRVQRVKRVKRVKSVKSVRRVKSVKSVRRGEEKYPPRAVQDNWNQEEGIKDKADQARTDDSEESHREVGRGVQGDYCWSCLNSMASSLLRDEVFRRGVRHEQQFKYDRNVG
jgi:hypothetical protein